jgi:DNA-binding Xre family transcriptional regulator
MIRWKLKSELAKKHQIYTVTELQKLIVKKTGVVISIANLCKYVNSRPKMVKLETMEIICSALGCKLESFLSITPEEMKVGQRPRKLSFKNTPKSKIGQTSFPEPSDYES